DWAKATAEGVKGFYTKAVDKAIELGNTISGALPGGMGNATARKMRGAAQEQVKQVAAGYGWDAGAQWAAIDSIVKKESSWVMKAKSPSSSAQGVFQQMTSIHGPVESTAAGQAKWGLNYIKGRYGSPVAAWDFHKKHNYYADGGFVDPQLLFRDRGGNLPPGLSMVLNKTGQDEAILNARQWSDIHTLAQRGAGSGAAVNIQNAYALSSEQLARDITKQQRRAQALQLIYEGHGSFVSEKVATGFVAPQRGVNRPPTVSIMPTGRPLSERIRLIHNTDKYGYILDKTVEGFGLAPIENTTVAKARGGASLRNRRWDEGEMFLPITLVSPSPESMHDMFARLVEVVTDEGDYFDVVFFDPYSQEARRRTVIYDSGLETVNEVSPTKHVVGVTAKFLSPWWRGPERVVTERIAPPVKPLITADPGMPVDRWPDPEFSDSSAYAPWLPVDGGLVKWGTGERHGGFFSSRLIAVSYGEVLEVSAQLSFMDGPHVGSVSVEVQAVDDKGDVIPYSARQAVLLPRSGRFTGAYVVPQNAEYVMV